MDSPGKASLLSVVTLVDQLQTLPCYEKAETSDRLRMCRSCSEDLIDSWLKFTKILFEERVGREAPPHSDLAYEMSGVEERLEEIPF